MTAEKNNGNFDEEFEVRDLRDKNWFILDNEFLNGYAKYIGIYAVGVYSSLSRHAGIKQKAYPSQRLIAEELDIGKNKIIESIRSLEFWNIIRKKRVGLHCNNRYYLLKKVFWKPVNEQTLKEFSEVCHINFRGLRDKLQKFVARTSKVRIHKSNNTQFKEEGFLNNSSNDDASKNAHNYKNGNKKYKPFYQGNPMRWVEYKKKWYVIVSGEWLEYADKESKIEWQ
jgi:predicted transcriptional regulator